MKEKNAVYPLSADPIHKGHLYNIETAMKTGLFDKLYVAICNNTQKTPLFTLSERVFLAKKAIKPLGLENIIVETCSGMLAHYSYERNAQVLIRGSRIGSDFDYEQKIAEYNQGYNLITFVIPSIKKIGDISSTHLKEIIKPGGILNGLTHPSVKQALEEKVQKVSLVGVTGNMGSGKTTFCKELEKRGRAAGMEITHYDIDTKIHTLYRADAPGFSWVYEAMKEAFGEEACQSNKINREVLAQIVWGDEQKRMKLAQILSDPFRIAFEKTIVEQQGIVLVDAAYLVEYDMFDWVNYNLILINCNEKERERRVMKRDNINLKEFNKKTKAQLPPSRLREEIKKQQEQVQYGFFYEVDSQKPEYDEIINCLKKEFPLLKNLERKK